MNNNYINNKNKNQINDTKKKERPPIKGSLIDYEDSFSLKDL